MLGVSTRAAADLAAAAGLHTAAVLPARPRAEVLAELKAHSKDRPLVRFYSLSTSTPASDCFDSFLTDLW